jgi:hypothetical protein
MFFAMAVLLIHPQLGAVVPRSADKAAMDATPPASEPVNMVVTEEMLPLSPVSMRAAALPEPEETEVLPEAPLPLAPVATPTPSAFIGVTKPTNPWTVSVAQLRAENRRKELMWRGLIIASSGAATFDAWSTRRAITNYGAQELDPLLKPFAGNASLYAAVQVGPALMDFIGRKMMYSRHSWMRNSWWVPQTASFVTSMFCGAHNVAYR